MLRQTLRSFDSRMTMTYLCRAADETVLRDHFSARDSPNHQSIIRLRESSEFESREAKGRTFHNRELACDPAPNLKIAQTATSKVNIKIFVWLVTQCPLRPVRKAHAPNQILSQQIMFKLKAHETSFFLRLPL